MANDEDTEKELEPSEKKLEDARRKGDIPRAADLTTAFGYAGFLLACIVFGHDAIMDLGSNLMHLLENSGDLAADVFSDGGRIFLGTLLIEIGTGASAWMLVPGLVAVAFLLASRQIVFAAEKLEFKASRINPVSNAGQKFGISGLFEFAKNTSKLLIYSTALFSLLWFNLEDILGLIYSDSRVVSLQIGKLIIDVFVMAVILSALIGTLDFAFQIRDHARKNKMSYQEMKDEIKESEGDLGFKSARRQRGQEIAMNTMLADAAEADVIIVNPTHYAVALKWSRMKGEAPICVAKGVDIVAARIREVANENSVPIHSDPPTARAIFASVNLGDQILPDHYKPVASAIRFAEAIRRKAKSRPW